MRHIGLSEVSVEELTAAREIVDVVSVQNLYNLTNRKSQDVLDYATAENIAFIPWFPIATGDLAAPDSPVAAIAAELGATPAQVALAWLLQKSPVVLPIPGTKSVEHLTENLGAASLLSPPTTWLAWTRSPEFGQAGISTGAPRRGRSGEGSAAGVAGRPAVPGRRVRGRR